MSEMKLNSASALLFDGKDQVCLMADAEAVIFELQKEVKKLEDKWVSTDPSTIHGNGYHEALDAVKSKGRILKSEFLSKPDLIISMEEFNKLRKK